MSSKIEHHELARDDVRKRAEELAPQFERSAAEVDRMGSFPVENLKLLRESGLLGLLVPAEYGGLGGDVADLVEIAQMFGAACASTALMWSMHCQQVATIVRYGSQALCHRVLPSIASGTCLVASITTEAGKGGHLLSAHAALERDDDRLLVDRVAPVVSGGNHADSYLVTMRTQGDRPLNDTSLAFVWRDEAEVTCRGEWDAMGMRGTESVGMHLRGWVDDEALVNGLGGFREVAVTTFVPVGHLAWAAVWLGVARGALLHVVAQQRDPKSRSENVARSDLAMHDLARVWMKLDTLSAYLYTCLHEYENVSEPADGALERMTRASCQLHINNLKIFASETAFEAVDELVSISGMREGYIRSRPLERAFRDLRSAALMYSNDRLLVANGRLALIDRDVELIGRPPTGDEASPFYWHGNH